MMRELEFLKIIADYPCVNGIGDDCAMIPISETNLSLVSTDLLIEGNHFPLGFKDLKAVGEKAVTVNVSDILAGGGRPERIYISLALPESFSSDDLKKLYDGLNEACLFFKIIIAGGDLTSTIGPLVISITITGNVEKDYVLTRNGAVPGDDVYVSGPLGGAKVSGYALSQGYYNLLPMDAIEYIVNSRYARCLTDISDGLARSLYDIGKRSHVGFEIEESLIPLAPLASLSEAMHGGEDYQVLFTASSLHRDALIKQFHLIGVVTESTQLSSKSMNGMIVPITQFGYDHFLIS